MASTPTTSNAPVPSASKEDGLGFMIARALRAAAAPNQTPEQQKATMSALTKAVRALVLNDKQAEAMAKALIEQPAEIMAKTLILMQKFADGQADMSIKAANEWMDANIRQGKSVMGIVNIARFVSTVARYFGAEEFAQTLDERSDAITADAKKYFDRIPAEQLAAQGREIAERAFRDQLVFQLDRLKQTADAIAEGTQTANRAQPAIPDGVTGQTDTSPAGTTPPSGQPGGRPVSSSEITRQRFKAEVLAITGDARVAETVTRQTFDPSANLPGGKRGVADKPLEVANLVGRIGANGALDDTQRTALYKNLGLKGPVEAIAEAGPR
jgi:hypothetical protein